MNVTEVIGLHRKAAEQFGRRVDVVGADQWNGSTPCSEWNVRQLVNHVVGENRWTAPLLSGQTIEAVGDRLDGDLLGEDPKDTWRASLIEAHAAIDGLEGADPIVHLSFGDVPASEYLTQLTTDLLIHGWDLAVATGSDTALDDEIVDFVWSVWSEREEMVRGSGVFGDQVAVAGDASTLIKLLGLLGRRG